MNRLCGRFLAVAILAGAFLLGPGVRAGRPAEQELSKHPRLAFEKARQYFSRADTKAGKNRIREALVFYAQGRSQLLALRKKWPNYRRRAMAREMHDVQNKMKNLYQLVEKDGLVEYRGRFYNFEQVRQLMTFQQERTQKWLELLRSQEDVRRVRTELLLKTEAIRQGHERPLNPGNLIAPQDRIQKNQQLLQQQEEQQRRMNQILKNQGRAQPKEDKS